jgi:lipopolysaccharide transport system permease protein
MTALHYLRLACFKAGAELTAEAARAYLGFLWWFVEPVLYLGVFYLLFSSGVRGGGTGFVAFLLCGLVVWKWFGSTVQGGSNVMSRNAGLIQQVYLPKLILPLVLVISNTVKFLIIFGILLGFLLWAVPGSPARVWSALPALLLVQLLLIAGCAGLVAALTPFIPDLKGLLDNFLMLLFFVSGIFYDIGDLPPGAQAWIMLNPVALLIRNYRAVLLEQRWPDWGELALVVALAAVLLAAAITLLVRFDRRYPKFVVK